MSYQSTEALINTLTTHWQSLRSQAASDLYQLRLDVPFNRSLSSLLSVPSLRKVYWQSRDGHTECAGLGAALEVATSRPERIPDLWRRMDIPAQGDTPIRFFGGMAFDTQQAPDDAWRPMGLMRFWVPHVMLQRDRDQTHLVVSTITLDNAALARTVQCVTSALQAQAEPSKALPVSLSCEVQPTQSQWLRQVAEATENLTQSQGKLVLSVRQSHRMSGSVDALQWFQRMKSRSQGGFQYYFQVGDRAFMGASPECLYERQAAGLKTEALAGTATSDSHLLDTPKETCEHDFVVRDMTEALARVCAEVHVQSKKECLRWQDLVHLKTALAGTLKAGVTDAEIIQALHPSAAVLGYPRDKAWQWLRAYEEHARGWYAGPVGWLDRDHAQFAVAIRCAMVTSNRLHFYAGAGLVPASRPLEEWQEVQSKLRFFQTIIEES